jgi:hypothetical protein
LRCKLFCGKPLLAALQKTGLRQFLSGKSCLSGKLLGRKT